MAKQLTILVAAKLHANQLERHLELLERLDEVGRILVVRHEPLSNRLGKVENVTFQDGGTLRNAGRMLGAVDSTLRRESVDWVLGFNPVPWGSVAYLGALRHRVPVCLSFIGLDYKHITEKRWATPLWLAVRGAHAITVTGERMRRGLVERGIPSDRIRVLPHSVDTTRFAPGSEPAEYDIVSVGQLIRRKRMDVLIDAVGRLRDRGITARVALLGKGPERAALEGQVRSLRLEDRVEFLGYRDDVEAVLRRARVFALVSEWEGVPFAMIEAMSSGLVPVVTDVGTIADFVTDGHNGHIVPVGDSTALADALARLLTDGEHFARLREGALGIRTPLSLEAGVEFWRGLLAVPGRSAQQ
jgi:glycosyltransferase involved in cell wall biosynthesis